MMRASVRTFRERICRAVAERNEKPEYLVITNTLHPYQTHNIPILSLLPGATYRFRYESPFFLMNTDEINALPGKFGLLVLREFSRGTFIPLRTFRFFRVEYCGEFVFLELEFLSYVKYEGVGRVFEISERDPPERKQLADKVAKAAQNEREKYSEIIAKVVAEKAIPNPPGDQLAKLIIPADPEQIGGIPVDDRQDERASVGLWSRIVTLLSGIPSYQKACFYLIGSVRDLDSGKKVKTFWSAWRRGLTLYARRGYALQVFQLMANRQAPPAPGFAIRLNHLEKHILPLRSSEVVDGAYDRLEFYFYVLPQSQRRTQSVLVVQCDQKLADAGGGQDLAPLPGSFMHVLVKWTKWELFRRRILPVPLFIGGVVVWFFADPISRSVGYGVKPEYVQLAALFLFAVSVQNLGVFTEAFKSPIGTKA